MVLFLNKNTRGGVAGIVGAGGSVEAAAADFLSRSELLSTPEVLMWLSAYVCGLGVQPAGQVLASCSLGATA